MITCDYNVCVRACVCVIDLIALACVCVHDSLTIDTKCTRVYGPATGDRQTHADTGISAQLDSEMMMELFALHRRGYTSVLGPTHIYACVRFNSIFIISLLPQ